LSIVDPVTQAKTPFRVPPNARIVGVTVLPLADPAKLCGPERKKSSLCMGFARGRKSSAGLVGYTGGLYVPTYGGLETQPVKEVTASGSGTSAASTHTFYEQRSIPIDITDIEVALPLAAFDWKQTTTSTKGGGFWPNAYHGLFRYLSPARMAATALANRSVGVTYENADVLLRSKKPQYFEWNSTASDDDANPYLQMHLSVWSFNRTGNGIADYYGQGSTDAEADNYLSLAEKVDVKVELVYELQSDTPDDREKAYEY
jgi:hypothetical protein